MLSLSDDNHSEVIKAFNSTSRYLDYLLNVDNNFFDSMVNHIYPSEFHLNRGRSGGAMVLGKLPVTGRPTIWIIVGKGPIALEVGADGVLFELFYSPLSFSLLFLPLLGRRPDID